MELETIGENAGKVWRTLNEMRGEISIQELSRKINLSAEDVALAVGWLARENNIFIQRHNYCYTSVMMLSDFISRRLTVWV